MSLKIISAVALCFLLLASAVACNKGSNNEAPTQKTSVADDASTTIPSTQSEDVLTEFNESSSFSTSDSDLSETESTDESGLTTTTVTLQKSVKAQAVEMYKNAAVKSTGTAKSKQVITLVDISVNNGAYEGVFKIVNPIMSKLLSNNSTETQGITGDFKNLEEADLAQAKIYKAGNNTAIEMTLREQTDGAQSDSKRDPVGHAISTVGDISVVTVQLNDLGLPIEISEENTVIRYTDPTVKVIVGNDGKIVCGTWNYTVEILLNNYKVGGKNVETTSVILNNTITVNGGFKK